MTLEGWMGTRTLKSFVTMTDTVFPVSISYRLANSPKTSFPQITSFSSFSILQTQVHGILLHFFSSSTILLAIWAINLMSAGRRRLINPLDKVIPCEHNKPLWKRLANWHGSSQTQDTMTRHAIYIWTLVSITCFPSFQHLPCVPYAFYTSTSW